MKCQHKNVSIQEYGSNYTDHTREDEVWTHNNIHEEHDGNVWFSCHDCGVMRRYNKRKPKWLLKILNAMPKEKQDKSPKAELECHCRHSHKWSVNLSCFYITINCPVCSEPATGIRMARSEQKHDGN